MLQRENTAPEETLTFWSHAIGFGPTFKSIKDWRDVPRVEINVADVWVSGFACMHFLEQPLLEFQNRMQSNQHVNHLSRLFRVKAYFQVELPCVPSLMVLSVHPVLLRYSKKFTPACGEANHLAQYQIFPEMYYFPIDGSQFCSSKKTHCDQRLVKHDKRSEPTYSHQVLQGGIAHPDCSQVIPFVPA